MIFGSLGAVFKMAGHKSIWSPYERPPFPIKVDKPTVGQIMSELKFSDFFMFGTLYGTGIGLSYMASRPFPVIG